MLEDKEINDIEENKVQNEIVEIDENEEIVNTQYDLEHVENNTDKKMKKKKEKKPSKWSMLSKKQKIIIIISIILVLLVIVGVILYFFLFNKDEHLEEEKEPVVIIEKDNYRFEDGTLIFVSEDEKDLGSYECSNKNEKLCYVAYYSNEDEFDVPKNVYENGVSIDFRSDILLDNFVFIYDNPKSEDGNIKLYDINKSEVIDEYKIVKEVDENHVIVENLEEEYGLLNFTENQVNEVIDFSYDYLGYILDNDYVVGANNNNYILLDLEGNDVSKNIPGEIKNFDANNISVKIDGDYYIYDYEGIRQSEEKFDYIRFVSSYIIAASSKKLYIYDNDIAPMLLEGLRISSSSYNTKLIFNEDLVQTGKEEAFNASLSGNIITITFDDEVVNVNLNDGKFSKKQEYYSYLQGKLYIYKDAEKTELLGTYSCSYANSVDENTEELTNCFIAKEKKVLNTSADIKVGYLPIYNNRFVFIADTKTPNANDNIVLWDLDSNKKLATYKEVDAGFYSDEKTVNFLETAGLIVLAKNTSDSYGLINIQKSKVTGFVDFKDESGNTNVSVKMIGNNILFKRSDGTYHLYDSKGNEITENITTKNEIVDYKGDYILVKSNEKYLIYKLDGSIASKDEFKYIFLEETFYIAVNEDNSVSVYSFSKGNLDLALLKNIKVDGKDIKNEIKYGLNGSVLVITYKYNDENQVVEINIG